MSIFKKSDKKIETYQKELIEEHYKEVESMYNQMRGWRHDYRNHIQLLKILALKGDIEGIKKYLNELDTDLQKIDISIKTGNEMADAILNSKISLAKAKEVNVIVDANIPVKLNINDLDLCIVIGNLFDNAIDASLLLPKEERLIRVYMTMKNTQLYISMTNFTSTKKQKKIGTKFPSTKGKGHGFGLVHIESVVKKLNGYYSCNSEDGAFTTEILIPQM